VVSQIGGQQVYDEAMTILDECRRYRNNLINARQDMTGLPVDLLKKIDGFIGQQYSDEYYSNLQSGYGEPITLGILLLGLGALILASITVLGTIAAGTAITMYILPNANQRRIKAEEVKAKARELELKIIGDMPEGPAKKGALGQYQKREAQEAADASNAGYGGIFKDLFRYAGYGLLAYFGIVMLGSPNVISTFKKHLGVATWLPKKGYKGYKRIREGREPVSEFEKMSSKIEEKKKLKSELSGKETMVRELKSLEKEISKSQKYIEEGEPERETAQTGIEGLMKQWK